MNQLQYAYQLFDDYNRQDPRLITWRNVIYPQEYAYSLMLCEWVNFLQPASGEELLLASRCQHIGRWEIPRDSYPDGREPYLKWRKDLANLHAGIAANLLQKANYEEKTVNRVKEIILKKRIKQDCEIQIMENALCLVFLEYQYEDLRIKYLHTPDKMINILYRSLLKMDSHGHAVAMLLNYTNEGMALIKIALEKVNQTVVTHVNLN